MLTFKGTIQHDQTPSVLPGTQLVEYKPSETFTTVLFHFDVSAFHITCTYHHVHNLLQFLLTGQISCSVCAPGTSLFNPLQRFSRRRPFCPLCGSVGTLSRSPLQKRGHCPCCLFSVVERPLLQALSCSFKRPKIPSFSDSGIEGNGGEWMAALAPSRTLLHSANSPLYVRGPFSHVHSPFPFTQLAATSLNELFNLSLQPN